MRQKKPYAIRYLDGMKFELPNRRVLVVKGETGFYIEFVNIIKGKKWKPVRTKRIKGCKVVTVIHLSDEAVAALAQAYTIFGDRKI